MATQLQYSLPEKFHGQRNLVGHRPWGHKESVTTEHACASYFVVLNLPPSVDTKLFNSS